MKSFVLLAGLGLLFCLPDVTQATETTPQIKAQESTIVVLEKQVTENQNQQVTLEEENKTLNSEQEIIEKEIVALNNEQAQLQEQLMTKEERLRVVAAIQGVMSGANLSGYSINNHENEIKTLKEKMATLEATIAEKETTLSQLEADVTTNTTEKETLVEEFETLTEMLADEKATLETLKEEQAIAEEKAKAAEAKAKQLADKLAVTGFLSPLKGALNVSSSFGYRADPTGYSGNMHDGIDYTGNQGEAILAARYGTVVEAGNHWSAGNYAIIQHDNGYYTYYMHMTDVYVTVGQSVTTLEQIGTMGTTGNSTGVHLHFGIATDLWSGFVDPANFIY
ncbi:peptidoglycan DD-metalloendopeptidase family protein [Enterococcus sp. DIV1314a]|uniref:M23 family metallopeptidase n=1 Tax=Enterococcus sp. DIV1314a TaxID=2774660 RepID=UPI003F6886F6